MAQWKKPKFANRPHMSPDQRAALNSSKEYANRMLERGRIDEAMRVLEPLVANHPNDVDLLMMWGICLYDMGDPDAALLHYERAYELDRNPVTLYPMGLAYLQLAMRGSALHAFTESIRSGLPVPDEIMPVVTQLRQDVSALAGELRLPQDKVIAGLRQMERGLLWLDRNDYRRGIDASRAAIKVLGDWPPPHNNLALALFYDGQPAQAIAESRKVLRREPENLMAAGNLVRFLAWSGERSEAEEIWRTLRTRTPRDLPLDALKLVETAGILDDDESVHRFLLPLASAQPEDLGGWLEYLHVQKYLAKAEANLGNPRAAIMRLRALKSDDDHIVAVHDALRDGKKGLGLTPRFAYVQSIDLLSPERLEEFWELVTDLEMGDDPKAGKKLREFTARFPQLVVLGEKLIWEENAVEQGIFILRCVATPAAHDALRRFAASQAGSDEQRGQALMALQLSGGAQPGEVFRLWRDGSWHELELRGFTIAPRFDQPVYKASVAKLLKESAEAMLSGEWDAAIVSMRKATELEPRDPEIMNNLAVALEQVGDPEASRVMLERALAIKPDFVSARINLALKLIAAEELPAAVAMMAPLEKQATFTPEEFTAYQVALGSIAFFRKEYEAAHNHVQQALTIDPEYEPALGLLKRLERIEFGQRIGKAIVQIREMFTTRTANYRLRQQARLTTLTPSLADAVEIYSAELLRAIAKAVAPELRVSGMRKAQLQGSVREALLSPPAVQRVVNQRLTEPERAALGAVLAGGGVMARPAFRSAYGDEGDESPLWHYHPPSSVSGRLRLHGVLVEATIGGTVYLVVPVELRAPLAAALGVAWDS